MAGPISIAILANAFQAIREMRRTVRESNAMGRALEAAGKVSAAVASRMAGLATGILKAAGLLAQLASTAAALAPLLAKAGGAILNVAKAAGNAAPALAAFAAAAVFIKLTMAQIGPVILKALSPIADGFKKAGAEAGKLAAKGVAPLAAQFNRLGMPIISAQMNRIGVATNGVVKGFLNWAKSGPGLTALRSITTATATAFEKVAPAVLRLGIALGEMIGRIAGVSLAAGSKGLVGVLDKVTGKLETVNAKTVRDGLRDLKEAFIGIRDTILTVGGAITKAVGFYKKYETAIKAAADASAVFTIGLALFFGGPVGLAVFAAVGLLIRHFDTIKAVFLEVKAALSSPGSLGIIDQLKGAAQTVLPAVITAFNQIKAAVLPTLTQIFTKIKTELIPAFVDFVVAMAPVVRFMVETLGPIVATVFGTIVKVISSALDIVIGIYKVFTGILTGDWSKTWEGIKQILSGALGVVKALISGAWTVVKQLFSAGKAVIAGIWNGMWALVKDAVSTANAAIASKLAQMAIAVRNKFNEAKTAARQKIGELVTSVRDGIGRAVNAITSIDLFGAGRALISRLLDGIKSMIPNIGGVMDSISGKIRGFLPGSPIKEGPLKPWNSGAPGSKLINLLIKGIKRRRHPLADAISRSANGIAAGFTRSAPITALPVSGGAASRFGGGGCCGPCVTVNFNGVVGDPVAVGREIEGVIQRYRGTQGRR